jgi:hypothetical protein
MVLNVTWHWGRESSVVSEPLRKPARTTLYVGLLFAWGSVDGDRTFSLYLVGELLNWGLRETNE